MQPNKTSSKSEATKAAVDKGKQNVLRVVDAGKNVLDTAVAKAESTVLLVKSSSRDDDGGGFAENVTAECASKGGSEGGESGACERGAEMTTAAAPMPAICENTAVDPMADDRGAFKRSSTQSTLPTSNRASDAPAGPASSGTGNTDRSHTSAALLVYTAMLSMYQAYSYRSSLLSNRIPLAAVFPLLVVAFLLGWNMEDLRGRRKVKTPRDKREGARVPSPKARKKEISWEDDAAQTSDASWSDREDEGGRRKRFFSRTRTLVARGRSKVTRFVKPVVEPIETELESGVSVAVRGIGHTIKSNQPFFTSLAPHEDARGWEVKLRAPFSEGPLMDHLLKYSDFKRRRTERKMRAIKEEDTARSEEDIRGSRTKDDVDSERSDVSDISIGHAKLNNTRAESLESDANFADLVVPMCELRGMDMFLADDPEDDIWRQPLLNECGLRDTATFVANLMMPFGNMTAYFKMPDWFDEWSNIPEEKEDDPPDVKALKRFLAGDAAYRNARCKVIPYVVDGPLAVRLIKPAPGEHDMDGPRHPTTWTDVPKSVDRATGKTNAALMECDTDLFSERAVRKIINIIRPHLHRITIDVAIIISAPKDSEVEEPSACLGLWRIERVDFEECAVFPELAVEDAAEKVKLLMSQMEERVPVEASGGFGRRNGISVGAA